MTKKFNVIYTDFPWTYDDKASAGKRGAFHKYPLMTNEEIASIPINAVADKDCALFAWVTYPKLPDIFPILDKWGFTYKTVGFTWVKTNKVATDTLFWGMGRWTRSNPEICIIATRGSPKRADAGVHSVIMTPIGKHSAKPIETYERIEKLMGPDTSKLELFARGKRPGWTGVGYDLGTNVMDIDKIDFEALENAPTNQPDSLIELPQGTGPIIQNDQ